MRCTREAKTGPEAEAEGRQAGEWEWRIITGDLPAAHGVKEVFVLDG